MIGYTKGILATINMIMVMFHYNIFGGISTLRNTHWGFLKADRIHVEPEKYHGGQAEHVEDLGKL